jgi:hypothetical protein
MPTEPRPCGAEHSLGLAAAVWCVTGGHREASIYSCDRHLASACGQLLNGRPGLVLVAPHPYERPTNG